MNIQKINKLIALFIICSMVVTNLGLNVYAQHENTFKQFIENKEESKEIIEIKAENKDSEKDISVVKELIDLRTTNSTTYLLSDGSRKLDISGGDIRYEENGVLKDYNPELKKFSNNNKNDLKDVLEKNDMMLDENEINDFAYVNTAGDSKLYFPEVFDENKGILLKKDNYFISFKPLISEQEINNQEKQKLEELEDKKVHENNELLDVEQKLKKDSVYSQLYINNVEGSNITYVDKRGDIEYQYTSLTSGVKEEIVLKERPDKNVFVFKLDSPGMRIEKEQFGKGLNIINKETDEQVAFIDEPNIKDKDGKLRYKEVSYEIKELKDGNYSLKIIVDENYLKSSDTKYPVIIDPTVVWMDSRLPCVTLSNDTATADNNLKVNSYFAVQNRAINTESDSNTEYMCCICTNQTPFLGDLEKFYGSKVESASLKIVEYNMENSSYKPGIIEVRTPNGLWSPNTLTWNNHPEIGDRVWAQFTTTGTLKRHDVNLTNWAQAVANQEIIDYGLVLKAKSQGTGAYFYGPSLQNSRYMQLSIIYYPYVATVNHYYDNTYDVRYSQAKYGSTTPANVIKSHQDWANTVFEKLFGLKIISNEPQRYTSLTDRCKLNQGMAIDTISMNDSHCPGGMGHGVVSYVNDEIYDKCSSPEAAHQSFIMDKPGSDTCCNALWTGNQFYFVENGKNINRAWFSKNSAYIFDLFEPNDRVDRERRYLIHELAHNFGAPDEYCYDENIPVGRNCGAAGCPDHTDRFIGNCIMGKAMYDSDRIKTEENIFCKHCIDDIKKHLNDHHRVSPLVVTPNDGETIGKAIKRTLDTNPVYRIFKIKITGNAVMESGIDNSDYASILPNLKEVDLSTFKGTLGARSFYNCSKLEKVKLPKTIELPSHTFAYCKKLNTLYKEGSTEKEGEIDLSGITSIGSYAFHSTAAMTIKLPEKLVIPKYCFMYCKNLESIYKEGAFPIEGEADLSGVTSLGIGAFWFANNSIERIKLPKNVAIPDNCFQNCSNLKEVRFDMSQTSKVAIGTSAFYGVNESCIAYMNPVLVEDTRFVIPMSSTTSMPKQISPLVVTPNTGETIEQAISRQLGSLSASVVKKMILRGNAVMADSTGNSDSARILPNLESVDLSGFNGTLGKFVFFNCSNLKNVVLPDNIKIPENAFRDCTKLNSIHRTGEEIASEEIDLSGVTSIGNFAFRNAESISVVKLPAAFTISQYCFMECKNLRTVYKIGNSPVDGEIDLSGVSTIGYAAFYNDLNNINEAPKYNTVKLPVKVAIPGKCFRNSANLTTIYKNGSEKVVGVADLSGITSFGGGAFSGTGGLNAPQMSTVILPKNVAISSECFLNCGNLKKVELDETQTTKMSIGASAFYGVNGSCIAYMNQTLVKDSSFVLPMSDTDNMPKQLYALTVKPNSGETMKQAITRELGTIPEESVKRLKIQGNVIMNSGTSNEDSAKMLPELEMVDLSEFTGKLGSFAFHTCTKLKTVILPAGNINLPVYAFSDCENLDTVYKFGNIPVIGECDLSGVVSSGNYAFMNTVIDKVRLPSLFAIPQYCFMACRNLSTIYKTGNSPVIGELDLSGVSTIGYGAFWNYFSKVIKFNTIKLPESISISGNCFRSCGALTTIYKNGKPKVNEQADLSGVTSFGGGAFSGISTSNAPQISVVLLPKNVAIAEKCFQNCSNLKKVKFDETQTIKVVIGASAFYGVNGACVAYMNQVHGRNNS
ncbi:MAG: leucine-rich repeat protein [Eubacterium sp.]|nr:leucine-rich repeat protein [Eubacterium sp.]